MFQKQDMGTVAQRIKLQRGIPNRVHLRYTRQHLVMRPYLRSALSAPVSLLVTCLYTAALFAGLPCAASAQTAAPATPEKTPPPIVLTVTHARPDYAGESAVIERSDSVWDMKADGTGYRERTMVIHIQSEAALRELSVVTIPFASASEHVDILYARARKLDGSVVETPPADAQEQAETVTREAPFYSDLKQKQLPIKNLQVGDRLEWKVRIARTKAEAPNQFWGQGTFSDDVVTLSETVELRVPKGKAVIVWTNPRPVGGAPTPTSKPTETDDGAEHVYRWEHSNLKPTAGPAAEAERTAKKKRPLTPEEDEDARLGALPAIAWTTFSNWAAVGEWYRGLEASRVAPDDAIRAKVAELTAGLAAGKAATEEDKVRAVYGFVAPQIRYIGVAFGIGRYQPHPAGEVLENQYGDCKDKHTLLASMLTVLGLHPDAVLIGAGIRLNPDVPSPEAFNHLITQVAVDGKPVWLDATAEVAPFRMLSFPIRDKQALVIPETGEPRLERTPADPPFASAETMKAVGVLGRDGTSTSRITISERGDGELLIREVLRQVPPAQYSVLVQKMSESMGYSGTASNPDFGRTEDTARPLEWSYDYKREKSGDWDHFRIVPQLMPAEVPVIDEKDPPVASIDLGAPRTITSTAEMKLPTGWGAELPEAVHAKSGFATLDTTYHFENGTVYAERRIVILKPRVPASDWRAYKKWTDAGDVGQEEFIQLTRTGAVKDAPAAADGSAAKGVSAGPPPASPSNAEAAKLIRQAFQNLEQHDYNAVAPLLEQAKALNPTQRDLNGAYAALDFGHGEMTEALKLYKKEIALHPESTWVYRPMVLCQIATGHRPEAVETARTWTAADPADPAAVETLMSMLMEDGNAAGAAEAGERAVNAMPEDKRNDPVLQTALGRAQLKAGMDTSGTATLLAILKNPENDSPLTLNNAAYELADAGKELPLSESTERKALQALDEESRTWTLDETMSTLRQKSSLLVSSWDTMGWILYREGKLPEAQAELEAAWNTGHRAVMAEHLGEVEAASGNHTEALRQFRIALATQPSDFMGTHPDDTPDIRRLKARVEAEKKAGGKELKGSMPNFQQLRTFPLGPAAGRSGAAEYKLLVGREGVVKAMPTGEKSVTGGDELLRKAALAQNIPAGSNARLAMLGILNCHADKCELVLEP